MSPLVACLAFLSLGGQELIFIFFIFLLLFGARKLPELARGLGRSLGEFKRARDEFAEEIHRADEEVKRPPLPAGRRSDESAPPSASA